MINQKKRYPKDEVRQYFLGGDPNGKIFIDLGCGTRKRDGYIGVDVAKVEGVDIVCNIAEGLPFEDNIVDGIFSNFFFEHVTDTVFLFQEIYRVCKNGAFVEFKVPYYQSVTQYKDPTHKAIIMPEMMRYFTNDRWYGSDYGINVNFKMIKVSYNYLPPLHKLISKKIFFLWPITVPFLLFARRFFWNVVHSITIKLEVIK